jgi:hypothetical protein
MSGILAKLLRQKEHSSGDVANMSASEKSILIESLTGEAEKLRQQNADYAKALSVRLAGNYQVTLNERPDGTGFVYGIFYDATDNSHRVDVMPPRDVWSGDFNSEAAHPTDWVVYLAGEEVQRAASIGGLSVLAVV